MALRVNLEYMRCRNSSEASTAAASYHACENLLSHTHYSGTDCTRLRSPRLDKVNPIFQESLILTDYWAGVAPGQETMASPNWPTISRPSVYVLSGAPSSLHFMLRQTLSHSEPIVFQPWSSRFCQRLDFSPPPGSPPARRTKCQPATMDFVIFDI